MRRTLLLGRKARNDIFDWNQNPGPQRVQLKSSLSPRYKHVDNPHDRQLVLGYIFGCAVNLEDVETCQLARLPQVALRLAHMATL